MWLNQGGLPSRNWVCAYCRSATGNDRGYAHRDRLRAIYLCPICQRPTYFEGDKQVPGIAYGNNVDRLPADIDALYQEARGCTMVGAYTSCVLSCRKLLAHVAVEQGAEENKSFAHYVAYLLDGNILPRHFQTWGDRIRQRGNEANHRIALMEAKDAADILSFTEMLLKLLYEYPTRADE